MVFKATRMEMLFFALLCQWVVHASPIRLQNSQLIVEFDSGGGFPLSRLASSLNPGILGLICTLLTDYHCAQHSANFLYLQLLIW